MSKVWISGGGGAGAGSDDCTATSADVIKGKTAVTSDSDDEPISGTIEERSGYTAALSLDSNSTNKTIYARIPFGAYRTGTSIGYPEISVPFSDIAAKTGVTSGKILAGQSACGVTGTATSDATAGAGDILSGKTAYVNGNKINGTAVAGKRFADGTVPGSATKLEFVLGNGTTIYTDYCAVSGLSFTPSIIIIVMISNATASNITSYFKNINIFPSYPETKINATRHMQYSSGTTSLESYGFKLTGNAYVTNGSFRLPAISSSSFNLYWMAIE